MTARGFLFFAIGFLVVFVPCFAFSAEGEVIGKTSVFHLVPDAILVANDPAESAGVHAFNYFFCLEFFVGLLAVWVKMFLAIFKKEVL